MLVKNRGGFAAHASPEAIAAYLREARAVLRRQTTEVEWLERLLERRTAEKAAGVWPGSAHEEARDV